MYRGGDWLQKVVGWLQMPCRSRQSGSARHAISSSADLHFLCKSR